jgi:hypothetical protein
MKKGIGPRGLGAPKSVAKMYVKSPAKQTKDSGFYVGGNGKTPKGEMGSGFYIDGDGNRSHTPNFGGNSNVDPGFNIDPGFKPGPKKKIIKKVVKRKIETPITAVKPKPIPRIAGSPLKQTKAKKAFSKELKPLPGQKVGNKKKLTTTYNAATGVTNDPYYNPAKAKQYEKNAIAKYGSLEASRKAYKK